MKHSSAPQKQAETVVIRAGSVVVKVYRWETRGRSLFIVAYRDTSGGRIKKSFAALDAAKTEAYDVAANIQNGQLALTIPAFS